PCVNAMLTSVEYICKHKPTINGRLAGCTTSYHGIADSSQSGCRDRGTFVFVNIFAAAKNVRADMRACAVDGVCHLGVNISSQGFCVAKEKRSKRFGMSLRSSKENCQQGKGQLSAADRRKLNLPILLSSSTLIITAKRKDLTEREDVVLNSPNRKLNPSFYLLSSTSLLLVPRAALVSRFSFANRYSPTTSASTVSLLAHIETILFPRLKFILEVSNNKLNFLDVTLIKENNHLIYDWYQKPTSSGRYLSYLSQHHHSHKIGVIISLTDRVLYLSHPRFHQLNFHKIIKILLNNGYPLDLIFNTINKRIHKKLDLHNRITSTTNTNDNINKTKINYFTIPYIQTSRTLKTRISEHRNHINRNTQQNSVITNHRLQFSHDFNWDNIKILDKEISLNKRLISEMIYIRKQKK
ncbi:hypothetical protein ALC62_13865, partial [Cyphomyrmex costatus]